MVFLKNRHGRLSTFRSLVALMALGLAVAACGGSGNNSPTEPGGPPTGGSAQIGVIGCSQTTHAWQGWLERGDARVWNLVAGYGGGALTAWERGIPDGEYWGYLEQNIRSNPPANILWWEICTRNNPPANVMIAEAVLQEIRNRFPDATIYLTHLPDFENPDSCAKQNIAESRILVDYLIGTGAVLRGPELPMVMDEWIQPPQGDGRCHVGPDGRVAFGEVLANFNWQVQ